MTTIIICASQDDWTETTRKPVSVQSSAYGVAALFQSLERSLTGLAICAKGVVQARAGAVLGSLEKNQTSQRLPVRHFQSAAYFPSPCSVITAASSLGSASADGLSLRVRNRLFLSNLFGPSKVARHLLSIGFHRALTVRQDDASDVSNVLHFKTLSSPSLGSTASVGRTPTSQKEVRKCPKSSWRNPK